MVQLNEISANHYNTNTIKGEALCTRIAYYPSGIKGDRVIQKSNFKFVGEIEIDAGRYNHYRIHKKIFSKPHFWGS